MRVNNFDPTIKPLIPGYLARRRDDLSIMRQALAEADFGQIGSLAQNLDQSCSEYGLAMLSATASRLRLAAEQSDSDTTREAIMELESALEKLIEAARDE
ncbi:MAG: hypothetical protein HKM24_02925 [Gammaproteobacteria bacterium]|nr:hypothetical protein [Gammaproteobacteria bacterium]